jgi:hypothetical protein
MSRPNIFSPIHKASKFHLNQICSKLQAEVASLRAAVTTLQAVSVRKPAPIADDDSELEAARQKRINEREAARRAHAEFLAKQAAAKPEKDKARAEWEAKEKERRREQNRAKSRKWRAKNLEYFRIRAQEWRKANPEKAKAQNKKTNARRAAERAAAKQIPTSPDLLRGPQ